jgi:hypothetical protein
MPFDDLVIAGVKTAEGDDARFEVARQSISTVTEYRLRDESH